MIRLLKNSLIPTLCMLFLSACSSSGPSYPPADSQKNLSNIKAALIAQYNSWKGTPYKWGGQSRDGVDCSGFMQLTFKDKLNTKLPRSTQLQAKEGSPVKKTKLEIGDLVFFKTSRKVRHVGVYLGNQQFLHASTNKGVTISHLNNPYWQDAYWMARRVR